MKTCTHGGWERENQCIFELGECNLVNLMISGISADEFNIKHIHYEICTKILHNNLHL